jgi:hypothetical protein
MATERAGVHAAAEAVQRARDGGKSGRTLGAWPDTAHGAILRGVPALGAEPTYAAGAVHGTRRMAKALDLPVERVKAAYDAAVGAGK